MILSIFKSSLDYHAYPMANPADWLIGDWWELDPVLAGRLAYFCYKYGIPLVITETYRSLEVQKIYYAEAQQWKKYKKLGPNNIKSAAKPGTSWHGIRLAADASKTKQKTVHPIRNTQNGVLAQYGLCKPISSEPWHIQPIETRNMGTSCKTSLCPVDLAPALKRKFNIADATIDFLARYQFASQLAIALLGGIRKFSAETMTYLQTYKYWSSLKVKLGL